MCADVDFVKSFIIKYTFDPQQLLRVEVYNNMAEAAQSVDGVSPAKQDRLGAVEFDLVALAGGASKSLTRSLAGTAAGQGTVTVQAADAVASKQELRVSASFLS